MSLVSGREVLLQARAGGYAVGHFNFNDMEALQAIAEAADAEQFPVFLGVSEGAIAYAGLNYIVAMARAAAAASSAPMVLHLDHGRDLGLIRACIEAGFTSVMIDASYLPFEENVRQTSQVVAMARPHGVSVEAELGKLKGVEDIVSVSERDAVLVDPVQAERFVHETQVDSLAPAIGTAHGAFKFKGEPKLDIERLREVNERTGIPLVLHGASSVPAEVVDRAVKYGARLEHARGVPLSEIREAIRNGICKVNVDTDLRLAMLGALRQVLAEQPAEFDPRKLLGPARDAMREVVRARIRVFR